MRQRGATLVEAAIVLPILVFVLFGLVQFALIFTTEANLRAAAATGARVVSLSNPPPTDGEIVAAARAAATAMLDDAKLQVAVSAGPINDTKRLNLTYTLPLLMPQIVPGSVGGNLDIVSSAIGKCNGACP
ncbi:MAG: pilus assembly protein [Deltaproteobacteria bacterium]|nr:pilus assembly protein [Deltaproteobacteria bacterium]